MTPRITPRIEVCDSRRVFVPAHQTVLQFFHASEASLLVMTTDQDIHARFNGQAYSLRGGECITIDDPRCALDLRTIELRAGERKAEVNIMFSYRYVPSAVDQLAELGR